MTVLYTHSTARKRYWCEHPGHLGRECWIEPGDEYIIASLVPGSDLGNRHWMKLRHLPHPELTDPADSV